MTNQIFNNEEEFENTLINELKRNGWKDGVLEYQKEKDLENNWKEIIFQHNKDRLNNCELTDTEFDQIKTELVGNKTAYDTNIFINGNEVKITRDNPGDKDNLSKEVYLRIFNRLNIAQKDTTYQIARQTYFSKADKLDSNKRSDVFLLINGMPVFHIELKRDEIKLQNAIEQFKNYSNYYTGIFSLVQVLVAMTPSKTIYFARPDNKESFNPCFFFQWTDFGNKITRNWDEIVSNFLSIPKAHQLIGWYTIPDEKDKILKVLRPYQIHAITEIWKQVEKHNWDSNDQRGGYIWHTTGSGKTMTSYKTAQFIYDRNRVDLVIFLVDRIELEVQSSKEYSNFSKNAYDVKRPNNKEDLKKEIEGNTKNIIITSIQKMERIDKLSDKVKTKKIIFIVDECHRSTHGEMLLKIKENFPKGLFFGFTGTPIFQEN